MMPEINTPDDRLVIPGPDEAAITKEARLRIDELKAEAAIQHAAILAGPPTESVPRLPLRELRDAGYLQEVNRRFFHPLGLALGIASDVDDNGDVIEDGAELYVVDYRDDLEGCIYVPGNLPERGKYEAVCAEEEQRRPIRFRALGYWQQPVEGYQADSIRGGPAKLVPGSDANVELR